MMRETFSRLSMLKDRLSWEMYDTIIIVSLVCGIQSYYVFKSGIRCASDAIIINNII